MAKNTFAVEVNFNASCDDLWYHQMENHYDGIFLQETNHKNNSRTLENSKNWKVNMHTIFRNKTLGYGVRVFLPNTTKSVIRQGLINQAFEMVWTELEINAKRVLVIGNTCIPPNKIEQICVLDRFLEVGFNNSHKIAACDQVRVPKFWHM